MRVNLRGTFYKVSVFLYRSVAAFVLFAVLATVFAYGGTMLFYTLNTSWAAPIIFSPSDSATLQMTTQLVSSQQMLDALTLDRDRLRGSLGDLKRQRTELKNLDKQLDTAMVQIRASNRISGPELQNLEEQKKVDIIKTQHMLEELALLRTQIEKDLAAGFITKSDAAAQLASLTQTENAFTDSRVGAVLLRDSVRQKTTTGADILDILSRKAEVQSSIAQLDINISIGEQQVRTDQDQIDGVNRALAVVRQSPYYIATQTTNRVGFAFVPYDNESGVHTGVAVYDCYLSFAACRQVGTVAQVFSGEQHAINPFSKTDTRGFFIQLDLTHAPSAKSKTLFVGRKPLFF